MSVSFDISMGVNANPVRNIAGAKGGAKVQGGAKAGLRKALAHLERAHKRGGKYLRPGGGGKNPRQPEWPFIMTRTGLLKKSYTREIARSGMRASYGSDLSYAKYLEDGTRRGIRAREHMQKLERREGKAVEKIIADAIAKEFANGK